MEFMTRVQVEPIPRRINIHSRMLSLGSCFAAAVGSRMETYCFDIMVNPAGTLYNPESIALVLEGRQHEVWAQADGFNWVAPNNMVLPNSIDCLLLTFGTTHVYRLADGHVVANCHKQPSKMFVEDELSVDDIVQRYVNLIPLLRERHPDMQVLFTVSPYRYMKYGLHGSALSKARLLLAVDEICRRVSLCYYFPAYEIVTDELRDYRFYESDMVHPSSVAADYVWHRFQEACLDSEAQRFVQDYAPVRRALEHRPIDPTSESYRTFVAQTQQKRDFILQRYGILNR